MFGWEFPPHITGGLGTASYGLTKGLVKHDLDIIIVVPKAYGDEDQRAARIVNASDIPVDYRSKVIQEFYHKLTYLEVGSSIMPYIDHFEFEKLYEEEGKELKEKQTLDLAKKYSDRVIGLIDGKIIFDEKKKIFNVISNFSFIV